MLELGATIPEIAGNAPNNSANTRCGSLVSQPHLMFVLLILCSRTRYLSANSSAHTLRPSWKQRVQPQSVERRMASEWSGAAVRAYIAADATTLASHAFILNSRRIEEAALDCQQAFSSPHFLHAFAVKANPLSCVLDLSTLPIWMALRLLQLPNLKQLGELLSAPT